MVKMIITAPKDYDIEAFCDTVMAIARYSDRQSYHEHGGLFPEWVWSGEAGRNRYEVNGELVDFDLIDIIRRLQRFSAVEVHAENVGGDGYSSHADRFKDIGDEYHAHEVVEVLEGDIYNDALRHMYRE